MAGAKIKDMTWVTVGRVTVTSFSGMRGGSAWWNCLCECGNTKIIRGDSLRNGDSLSCGCLQKDRAADTQRKHGMYGTPEYSSWQSMKERCNNPRSKAYKDYGAKGVIVCDSWDSFEQFYRDMGPRPPGTSLGRKSNSLGYSAANCRWETPTVQANNTSRNVFYLFHGERKTLAEVARALGVNYKSLWEKVHSGKLPEGLQFLG